MSESVAQDIGDAINNSDRAVGNINGANLDAQSSIDSMATLSQSTLGGLTPEQVAQIRDGLATNLANAAFGAGKAAAAAAAAAQAAADAQQAADIANSPDYSGVSIGGPSPAGATAIARDAAAVAAAAAAQAAAAAAAVRDAEAGLNNLDDAINAANAAAAAGQSPNPTPEEDSVAMEILGGILAGLGIIGIGLAAIGLQAGAQTIDNSTSANSETAGINVVPPVVNSAMTNLGAYGAIQGNGQPVPATHQVQALMPATNVFMRSLTATCTPWLIWTSGVLPVPQGGSCWGPEASNGPGVTWAAQPNNPLGGPAPNYSPVFLNSPGVWFSRSGMDCPPQFRIYPELNASLAAEGIVGYCEDYSDGTTMVLPDFRYMTFTGVVEVIAEAYQLINGTWTLVSYTMWLPCGPQNGSTALAGFNGYQPIPGVTLPASDLEVEIANGYATALSGSYVIVGNNGPDVGGGK